MKEFIILGNGFDLSCNLSSSYKDFFKRRLDSLFNTTDTDEIINLLNNVSAESSYKREKNNNRKLQISQNNCSLQLNKTHPNTTKCVKNMEAIPIEIRLVVFYNVITITNRHHRF